MDSNADLLCFFEKTGLNGRPGYTADTSHKITDLRELPSRKILRDAPRWYSAILVDFISLDSTEHLVD